MGKQIRVACEYDDGKSIEDMYNEIVNHPDFSECDDLVIGYWPESYEDDCQYIIDAIAENKEKFSNIKSIFFGDMDFMDCEVSWIAQANYSKLWEAMPQLEALTIKGSNGLELGEIKHDNLKSLTIICGGLGKNVIEEIEKSDLKNLRKLLLYIGIEDYGFDGDISDIKSLVDNSNFPNLEYIGITDSDIEDDIVEAVFNSKYIDQVKVLDFSNGSVTKKGARLILDKIDQYSNIEKVDLHYHYIDDKMMHKLEEHFKEIGKELDIDEQNTPDEWDGEEWCYPMLTE